MTEIVGACLSQFHDDADNFELLLAFSDGREVGHTVSRTAAKNIAAEFANEFEASPVSSLSGIIAAFERAYPELYWHVAKGKLTTDEPLYGAAIFTDGNTEMGHGESDESSEEAFRIALEDAGLSLPTTAAKDSPQVLLGSEALRAAFEEIIKTNQIREFMGDDKNDGYGDQGWVTRDGQYARIARAALSATATEGE